MKTILYMAMTVNGYIAAENDETDWSDEDWESYKQIVKDSGIIVVGKRTYDIMVADKTFEHLDHPYTVVLTNQEIESDSENVYFTNDSPEKIIQHLVDKGFERTIIAGGGQINSVFLKAGLIDEIYLDIEPVLLGKGIQLFSPIEFENKLELKDTNRLNKNTIQLHYRIIKD